MGIGSTIAAVCFRKSFRANAGAARKSRRTIHGTLRVVGVDVFPGKRVCFAHELEVDGQKLRAKNFVIATGSRATIPKIEGIDQVPYFTNETIFDELREKPESMIVLGGGPIGCELGQTFSRLGVKVTIVQRGTQLLPR